MILHQLKIALRRLFRDKVHSTINLLGLSLGIAISMIIGLWIWDELSFDRCHDHYDRIAQVMQNQTYNGVINTEMGVPIPLAGELRKTYSRDFEHVVLSSWTMNTLVTSGEKKFVRQGNYVEQDAPEMLSLHMLSGSRAGLEDPSSIMISHSLSRSLFGDAAPLGKGVKLDNTLSLKVIGVYEDLPANSSFRDVSFLAPFYDLTSWTTGQENNWYNGSFQLFVQVSPQANMKEISQTIQHIKAEKIGSKDAGSKPAFFLQPMRNWHLYAEFTNGINTGGAIQYVWMFGIIGVFILLLACINFMNLSTARSEKRAKEVGIRKTIGSVRGQLIAQFYGESLVMTLIAYGISLVVVQLMLPFFNSVSGKQMFIPWHAPLFWVMGTGLCGITALMAGSYPALYLSSFQPIRVLKGTFKAGAGTVLPRKILVVIQFSVSVILIIGTLTVFSQIRYSKDRPMGYASEGLVNMIMQTTSFHDHFAALRTELIRSGAVVEIAESQSPTYEADNYSNGLTWPGKDPGMTASFKTVGVTPGYGKTVGWTFREGSDFGEKTDSLGLVINEAAVRYMGLKTPIGQSVRWDNKVYQVKGVIKDMIMESPYSPVNPTVFFINPGIGGILNLRLNPALSEGKALEQIASICKVYSPSEAIEFKFVNEAYEHKFVQEIQVGRLAGFFAALAVAICSLGLLGMISFMAEQRTKEIAIRKVLGASLFDLWSLLSKEFFILAALALCIGMPMAWYFMRQWLNHYPYHTRLSGWIFLAAGIGLLLITFLTISYQTIKTILANPVKNLKAE